MKNTHDHFLSRRELLCVGGLGLLTAGCSNVMQDQTATVSQVLIPRSATQPPTAIPRDSGMTHVVVTPGNLSLVRNRELCNRCGQCLDYCYRYATAHGYRSSEGRQSCIDCGQCSIQCETRSITERSEIVEFQEALSDPDKIVVATTSPAVRVALGEMFQMPPGSYVEDKVVAALKKIGCNYVLDTTFGADLTIMEEASELLHRLENKADTKYPLFTSCCPAWVKFAELFTPQLIPHISTTKSPIMIQGATIKTYFAQKNQLDPKRMFNVAITPCTAKKAEIKRVASNTLDGLAEVDLVLTVRELGGMLAEKKIDFPNLAGVSFDSMMGRGSGGGVAFGRSGGVMESALRTAYYLKNKSNAPLQKGADIRGEILTVNWVNLMPFYRMAGVRHDTIDMGDQMLRVAAVETPGSLRGLLDFIENDDEQFDFVEVMTCRGGCLGGGGQPYPKQLADLQELVYDRRDALQSGIEQSKIRSCHENSEVALAYREFFGEPLGEKSKALLHCR